MGAGRRRLVAAAGLAPDGDPAGCRWAAIRNLDRSVHIVATVVREDGHLHASYRDAFHLQAECDRIATELGHLTRPDPSVTASQEYRIPVPFITISLEPSGSVSARGSSDDLSASLLRHAGFRQIEDWHGRRHRLPTTTARTDRASIATHAAEMLRAARYDVDLDPELDSGRLATPTDPHGLSTAGQQILRLTDQIRGATSFAEAAEVLDQFLDPDDGVLTRLQEAMEVTAEQIADLDPDQYELADLFGFASDQLVAVQGDLSVAVDEMQRDRSRKVHADSAPARPAAPYSSAFASAALAPSPAVARASTTLGKPATTTIPTSPAVAQAAAARTR